MNKVAQKILSDAADAVAKMAEKSSEEAKALTEQHDMLMDSIRSEQEQKLDSLYRSELAGLLVQERLEHNKRILTAKWDVIDDLMARVREALTGDPALYSRFMEEMAIRGITTGDEKIVVSREDRVLIDNAFLERLNRKAQALTGHATNLRLSDESLESGRGLILLEERVEFNSTIDAVVGRIRNDHLAEITRMLFGREEVEAT